jgi:Family of unknown function (DUF5681)
MDHVSDLVVKRGHLFQPGRSGNPNGRPPGSRNRSRLALEALLDGEAEGLTRKAIELAKAGDITALRLCLDRIYPARKDTPVSFELPKLETAADAVKAMAAIMAAVASGDLAPAEANELGKLVDTFTRAIEAHELDTRLRRLEAVTK